jgi:hypothetical protein
MSVSGRLTEMPERESSVAMSLRRLAASERCSIAPLSTAIGGAHRIPAR